MDLGRRRDHTGEGISEAELAATPLEQVQRWVTEAQERQEQSGDCPEPLALSVATVDTLGRPNVRTVLMRFLDARGPGFLSSATSIKGVELAGNPAIAASLTWPSMFRAVRFRGRVRPVLPDELEDYWGSRPWGSRISARASDQSRPVDGRAVLEERFAQEAERWPDTGSPADVPRPEDWTGWRIDCDEVELWGGRRNRLHDRLVFSRVGPGDLADADAWQVHRRQP